ncbi:MAG TPA: hypothetical protein DD381_13750 [Lentisphaeria bacterium]|nr:MAG: hypothetical protein A2X47_13775 [Lentisphaerae bacterium GWF2_38_69]HBM17386.1 hypothetical protein [Lentisphaeria bacterium]
MKIRNKLFTALLILAIFPIIIVSTILFFKAKKSIESEKLEDMNIIANFKVKIIEDFINSLSRDLTIFQHSYIIRKNISILTEFINDIKNPAFAKATSILNSGEPKSYAQKKDVIDLMLIDTKGIIIYTSSDSHREIELGKKAPLASKNNLSQWHKGLWISEIIKFDNRYEILMVIPIYYDSNTIEGFVSIEVDMNEIYKLLEKKVGLGRSEETIIGTKTENKAQFFSLLLYPEEAQYKKEIPLSEPYAIPMLEAVRGINGSGIALDYRREKVLAAWRYIPSMKWGLVVKIDASEAFLPVYNIRNTAILIVIILLLASIFAALIISGSITKPIHTLLGCIKKLSEGSFDQKAGIVSNDEIGMLSNSFDEMTSKLKNITASRDELNLALNNLKTSREHEYKLASNLRESELKLKSIFDMANDGILIADIATKQFVMANPGISRMIGYPKESLLKMKVDDIHPEKHLRLALDEFEKAAEGNSSKAMNIPVKRKDGTIFYVDISMSNIIIDERPCQLGIFHDITERKRIDELLSQSTIFRQGIIDAISSNICVMDSRGKIVAVNKAWKEFAAANGSVSQNIGIGANYFSVCENAVVGEDRETSLKILEGLRNLLSNKISLFSYEYTCHSPYKKRWFLLRAKRISRTLITDEKFIVTAHTDITELKLLEEKLIIAKEAADSANEAKSKFLSTITHELRSPLNSILGFTEILVKEMYGPMNEKQKEFGADILESGHHLLSLINDVLDMAKIDAGKMDLNISDINLNSLINISKSLIKEQCLDRNIKLGKSLDSGIPIITADERKIKQVIYNMLSNALKFTSNGGEIQINSYLKGDNVIISVHDTGIGIEEKDKDIVFTEFGQIDSAQSRKYPGSGIGMPLSKKLMSLHGGKIWFESPGAGKGTTFFISLPLQRAPEVKLDSDKDKLMVGWSNGYCLNVKDIDDQHKKLIDFVSVLNEDLDFRVKDQVIKNVCKTLIEYTHYHFGTEENLMKKYSYPEIESHISAHKAFVNKVNEFISRLSADKNLDKDILQFVIDWLINHILKVDSMLCKFLNDKGIY